MLLDYDAMCRDPDAAIPPFLAFLGIEGPASSDLLGRLKAIVRPKAGPSKTIGRFREYGTAQFDPDDVAFAAELGFDTK